MHILIVEDDVPSQLFLKTVLKSYGPCAIAGDGAKAVRAYTEAALGGNPFDIVFMDIMMPEMDGLTAIDRIREFEAQTPQKVPRPAQVVVVTAAQDTQNIIHAYCAGNVFAYLKKPLDSQDLKATMAKMLEAAEG
ncbi:response regulator [Humidesulfovibrio sp.]